MELIGPKGLLWPIADILPYIFDKGPAIIAVVLAFAVAVGWPQLRFNNRSRIKVSVISADYSSKHIDKLPGHLLPLSYDVKLMVFNDGNRSSLIIGFDRKISDLTSQERSKFSLYNPNFDECISEFREFKSLPSYEGISNNWVKQYEIVEEDKAIVVKPDEYQVLELKGTAICQQGQDAPMRDRPLFLCFSIRYYDKEGFVKSKSVPIAVFVWFRAGNGPKVHSESIKIYSKLQVIME